VRSCVLLFVIQALSLWNCTPVGSASFLAYDLSLRCEGAEYRRMSAFNAAFVVGVVVGWPAFIVWYLRRVQLQERTADESVLSRVGFLFEQYRPEYLYWDVVETVRKLYLVTVVAFFESGTMLQLVLSVIVSSLAFAYHVYSLPYKDRWLNVLQGACLFMIWASLQAGMLMVTTQPSLGAGAALLTALSVANIVMLISPALLIVLAMLQVIPASIRARVSAALGWVADADIASENAIAHKSSSGPDDTVSTNTSAADGSATYNEHDDMALHQVEGTSDDDESVTSVATVQLEMVELSRVNMPVGAGANCHAVSQDRARVDLYTYSPNATEPDASADNVTRTNVRVWLLDRGASTDAASTMQLLMDQQAERQTELEQQAEQQNRQIEQLVQQVRHLKLDKLNQQLQLHAASSEH
jgi:hypothetical protein